MLILITWPLQVYLSLSILSIVYQWYKMDCDDPITREPKSKRKRDEDTGADEYFWDGDDGATPEPPDLSMEFWKARVNYAMKNKDADLMARSLPPPPDVGGGIRKKNGLCRDKGTRELVTMIRLRG